ncbi:hypothetical protein ACH5RR_021595 [Cinchona calisaya]|uniref:Uncharacterized protein n=1 Tax=Cinchona calisaya TaxID=153742 RepID=A0ABD2ZHQ7_9GENT
MLQLWPLHPQFFLFALFLDLFLSSIFFATGDLLEIQSCQCKMWLSKLLVSFILLASIFLLQLIKLSLKSFCQEFFLYSFPVNYCPEHLHFVLEQVLQHCTENDIKLAKSFLRTRIIGVLYIKMTQKSA